LKKYRLSEMDGTLRFKFREMFPNCGSADTNHTKA
jgi:hypothetical protein